jgi:beta-galactosidase
MTHRKSITRRDFLKSTTLTAVAALSYSSIAHASPPAVTHSSQHTLLDSWEYYRGALGGPSNVWGSDSGNHIIWQTVQLPHCFNSSDAVDPDTPYYEGPGWYRTRLKLMNPFPKGRTLMHFEGAGQKSEIFVGLNRVGQHLGGYGEFVVDITDAAANVLKDPDAKGEVPVAVLCDNSRDPELIPSDLNDFTRYGGLYRYVNLDYVPAISLQRVHIDAVVQPRQPARVSIKARLYNPASLTDDLEIQVHVLDPGRSIVHNFSGQSAVWDGEREITAFEVKIPQLWSPSRPSLYRCEIKLTSRHGEMSVMERFGFRYFEFVNHGPFKLNGERLLLKGTSRHEDHAQLGAAMPEELTRKEMELIKNMGANFIRLDHHQQSRAVLELCDELGLLVWEEIPWSRGGVGNDRYKEHARNMLRAMIDQHYNHPAVIIWGLGSENDWPVDLPELNKDRIRAFMKELNDLAHSLDPIRKTAIRRCDFCKDIVDVYSPSIWAGWTHGHYTDYKERCRKEMETVDHFIHMEWGGESHARRHSEAPDRLLAKISIGQDASQKDLEYLLNSGQNHADTEGDYSETYICNLFDWHLKEQETMTWLTGSAQWAFKDFSTPLRPGNPVPYVNQMGVVERDLALKEGYYVFQSYWSEKPMVHIYGHSWLVRWGDQDEQKLVKVYSNCETAELFLNNQSYGVKKRNSQDFPSAGLHWLVKFRDGENHLRVLALKNNHSISDEIRFHYQTEKWGNPSHLDLRETARANETVTVEARLLDTNNALCLDARNPIRFGIAGDGVLLDNFGTSTGSRSVQLYNGRAAIKLLTNRGKSMVSVTSKGTPTAFLAVG